MCSVVRDREERWVGKRTKTTSTIQAVAGACLHGQGHAFEGDDNGDWPMSFTRVRGAGVFVDANGGGEQDKP